MRPSHYFKSLLLAPFCLFASMEQINLNNILTVDENDLTKVNAILSKYQSYNSDIDFLKNQILNYSNNAYSFPVFCKGYYITIPEHLFIRVDDNVVNDINTYWDKSCFLKPRIPFKIGEAEKKDCFSEIGCPRCCHLPIKFPDEEIRIPNEYAQFKEVIQKIISFEYSCNDAFNEYYAYLTVDQRFVPKDSSQRIVGAHVDGIPRNCIHPETQKIDHCYLVSDKVPTKFYAHPFDLGSYSLLEHDFFSIMGILADEKKVIFSAPYDINLMNAYTVHSSSAAQSNCIRTFIRLEFSVLQFDRKGNSINPYFKYKWPYQDRFPSPSLSVPEIN